MIEYFDNKLGKMKVLNVTEARAHFATVLGDDGSHYIITKNNKPLRVIIDYEEYERLRFAEENQQTEPFLGQQTNNTTTQTRGLMAEQQQSNTAQEKQQTKDIKLEKKARKQKSRVPGLLETQMEMSREQKWEASQDPDWDYFQNTEEQETDEAQEQSIVTENKGIITDEKIKESNLREGLKPSRTENEGKREQTPDYFKKYKKLYEGFNETKEESKKAKEQEASGNKQQQAEKANDINFDLELETEKEERQQRQEQEKQDKKIPEKGQYYFEPEEENQNKDNYESRTDTDKLPSLKDLLKDLEEESLSDATETNENIPEEDIDQLIHRMTKD